MVNISDEQINKEVVSNEQVEADLIRIAESTGHETRLKETIRASTLKGAHTFRVELAPS